MSDDDIRARILQIAIHLFAHRGYGSTSVREVVETAGVTKPTLYYWFENKEALYREAVRTKISGLNELVQQTVEADLPLREQLRVFLDQYVRGAVEDRDGLLLAMKASYPTDHGVPQIDVASLHMQTLEPLCGLFAQAMEAGELRADLDPRDAVRALVGAANLQLAVALHGEPLPDDFAERMLDIFFRGVAR